MARPRFIPERLQAPYFKEIVSILNADSSLLAGLNEQGKKQLEALKQQLKKTNENNKQKDDEFYLRLDFSLACKEKKLADLLHFRQEESRRTWVDDEARFKAMEQQRKLMAESPKQASTPELDNTPTLTELLLAEDKLKTVTGVVHRLENAVILQWQNAVKQAAQIAAETIVTQLDIQFANSAIPEMLEGKLAQDDQDKFYVLHQSNRDRMVANVLEELSTRATPDEMIEQVPGFWEDLVEKCKDPDDQEEVKHHFANVVEPVYKLNAELAIRHHLNAYLEQERQLYSRYLMPWQSPFISAPREEESFLQDVINQYVMSISSASYTRMDLRAELYALRRQREEETTRFLNLAQIQMKPSPYAARPMRHDDEEEASYDRSFSFSGRNS